MKKLSYYISIIFLSQLFIYQTSYAQPDAQKIDSLVNHAMKQFKVAGLSIAVVKDGKILHQSGYGLKSADSDALVDKHTNFAIASNSKAFTSAAMAILIEQGKLKWEDKVKDHIPEFKMYNPYVTENFNIKDLLTHRSGLGLGVGDLMFFPDGSDFTIDDLLNAFQHFEPVSAFRTQFDYDNLLYLVAGEVIARVSGMSWESFVTEQIFKPLNMDNTYAGLDFVPAESNLSSSHSTDGESLTLIPNFKEMINGAAGGIYSNADDLSQWMLMQLNQGTYGPNQESNLFSLESQQEMWTIHTVMPFRRNERYNTHFWGYGLAWQLRDIRGNMEVSHTGGLPGMLSKITLIPDLDLGVAILTNTSDDGAGIFESVSRAIVDEYIGLDDRHWIDVIAPYYSERKTDTDSISEAVWRVIKDQKKVAPDVENILGTYEDPWFGKGEVFYKGEKLWFKFHKSPKLNGEMFYYGATTYAIKWEYQDMNCDAFAIFQLDENGMAKAIEMKGISPFIDFSFDFHDLDLRR